MYYGEPRTPSESDLQLIEEAGHVAVIAIEGERARAALEKAVDQTKKSEAELRTIIDAIPQAHHRDWCRRKISVRESDVARVHRPDQRRRFRGLFHPEDSERLRDESDAALRRGIPFVCIARQSHGR